MKLRPAGIAKAALTRVGARLPDTTISGLRVATGYIAVGKWVATNGWSEAPRVASRNRVFDAMMAEIGKDPVAYLEFGVYEGASLRYWVNGIADPDSEFHGFDSFEGLPETFDAVYGAGHFDRGGKTPDIQDPRVEFHVGWFEETLPIFAVPPGKRIAITLDADLYSATKLVLHTLDEHIVPELSSTLTSSPGSITSRQRSTTTGGLPGSSSSRSRSSDRSTPVRSSAGSPWTLTPALTLRVQ